MGASLAPGQLHGCLSSSGGDMNDLDEKFTNMGFHLGRTIIQAWLSIAVVMRRRMGRTTEDLTRSATKLTQITLVKQMHHKALSRNKIQQYQTKSHG